ncbi:S8 family serine peptidase [Streptomyces litchfieldiae]|uniref:S8 family serine peptidase n=1 Tax=Streptomyces litchfieldiae TaxID=3075543 RepID=A0ABU2MSC4_9ACTN|nr:S8 family serine peptidase [Streptomyces sp. DSM 44938]MDT0344516.1 S8 family serine peptidase [Streptomyces sp. DSM 44938]
MRLPPLMAVTAGRSGIAVALIDGPVAVDHPRLAAHALRPLGPPRAQRCGGGADRACGHGTFVAGILAGARGAGAPGVCAGCTLLVRPVFGAAPAAPGDVPGVRPQELAAAITEVVDAGAHVINLSLALTPHPEGAGVRALEAALDGAARRGVITVVAAGNDGTLGGSALTRHPATIPVVACDTAGRPLDSANLGRSIGARGLCAPGAGVTSLSAGGGCRALAGTSVAVPFVAGAAALLRSEFPRASGPRVRHALVAAAGPAARRGAVTPPLLDAWAAHRMLKRSLGS